MVPALNFHPSKFCRLMKTTLLKTVALLLLALPMLASAQRLSNLSVVTQENAGLPSNVLHCIAQAADGSLWAGAGSHLAHIIPTGKESYKTESFVCKDLNFSDAGITGWVKKVVPLPDGKVWVLPSMGNLGLFDGKSWKIFDKSTGLPEKYINDIALDAKGVLWAASRNGVLSFDGNTWKKFDKKSHGLDPDNAYALAPASDGSMIVGFSGMIKTNIARSVDGAWNNMDFTNFQLSCNYFGAISGSWDGLFLVGAGLIQVPGPSGTSPLPWGGIAVHTSSGWTNLKQPEVAISKSISAIAMVGENSALIGGLMVKDATGPLDPGGLYLYEDGKVVAIWEELQTVLKQKAPAMGEKGISVSGITKLQDGRWACALETGLVIFELLPR